MRSSTRAAPSTDTLLQALIGLGMPSGIALPYLETQVALRRFGDIWVRWAGDTAANMAEAVLHVLGAPATAEAILATINSRASISLEPSTRRCQRATSSFAQAEPPGACGHGGSPSTPGSRMRSGRHRRPWRKARSRSWSPTCWRRIRT